MIRVFQFYILLFISLTLPFFSFAEGIDQLSVDNFFKEREVVGIVEFAVSSDKLSVASKKYLDGLAPVLKKAKLDNKIIRFEGNIKTTLQNHADVELAMYRAKAVQEYFRNNHFIGNPIYISSAIKDIKISQSECVEIVIYHGYFPIDAAPVSELITTN